MSEISELTAAAERLTLELYKQKNYKTKKNKWIVAFEKFKRSKTLTRDMVETLIDKIYVHGQYELEIIFNFRDEYMYLTKELDKLKEEQS